MVTEAKSKGIVEEQVYNVCNPIFHGEQREHSFPSHSPIGGLRGQQGLLLL